jgi:hypothetical protein
VSFYVSTAIYFLLHCDEWDRFVAPPDTTEGGAFLNMVFLTTMLTTADVNIHALIAKYGIDIQIEKRLVKSFCVANVHMSICTSGVKI